ncbi:MAG: hypothetical protein IJ087_21915 [Eggerthellaceae bacterium]|nr:hypothetical protein [Eggerthellaceae bacterium]
MSKEFLSPFQSVDSWVEAVSFEVFDSSLPEHSSTISLGHSFDDNEFDQDGMRAVKGSITVECKWQDADGKIICQGACTIGGAVAVYKSAIGADCSNSELGLLLRANLLSILYGKARNTLELLSSNSKAGKRKLPLIAPFEYLGLQDSPEE